MCFIYVLIRGENGGEIGGGGEAYFGKWVIYTCHSREWFVNGLYLQKNTMNAQNNKVDRRHYNKGRPKLPGNLRRKLRSFHLPQETIDKLKTLAAKHGSQANVIIEAVNRLKE